MNNVLISILVPVYNVDKYLRVCLDSLINQTYQNIEIVLVDDGSKDGSGKICDEYAQKDTRIVVVHKENEGVAKARVTAFEHSHGELITFVDSDDYVDKQYVEKLATPILVDDCDMVSCDYCKVLDGKIIIPSPKRTGVYEKKEISDFIRNHYFYDEECKGYGMTIFLCTKMIKRKFAHDGLKEGVDLWLGEDQIGVFQMLMNCNKLCLIPDRLYYYVQYAGQATTKYNKSLWENISTLMERYQRIDAKGDFKRGIRIRTWLHIWRTIFKKMKPSGISKKTFCSHMRAARNSSYMKDYFKPLEIATNYKNRRKVYWLLKLKMFNLLYFLYIK